MSTLSLNASTLAAGSPSTVTAQLAITLVVPRARTEMLVVPGASGVTVTTPVVSL